MFKSFPMQSYIIQRTVTGINTCYLTQTVSRMGYTNCHTLCRVYSLATEENIIIYILQYKARSVPNNLLSFRDAALKLVNLDCIFMTIT